MRNEFISLFAELNAMELESLNGETKETNAISTNVSIAKPAFTAANLWNIHNRRRERTPRRYF